MESFEYEDDLGIHIESKDLLVYGNVTASLGKKTWTVAWDNGTFSDVNSNVLTKQQVDAGKLTGKVGNEEDGDVGDDNILVDESYVDEGLEEEVETDEHIKKRVEGQKQIDALTGTVVTAKSKNQTAHWTYVGRSEEDCHKDAAGYDPEPRGTDQHKNDQHKNVFKENWPQSPKLLDFFYRMYPGSVDTHIIRLNAAGKKKNPKFVSIDKREWLTYLGLFYGASLLKQKGRDLWRVPEEGDSIFSPSPNYNKYMSRNRFEAIKSIMVAVFTDEQNREDPWYKIRTGVNEFNTSRLSHINTGTIIVADESMSPFQPRTTTTAGLPHLSFIQRKPRPLGTEFKNTADGDTGIMLHLELQEGAAAQQQKKYNKKTNIDGIEGTLLPNTAIGVRLATNTLRS